MILNLDQQDGIKIGVEGLQKGIYIVHGNKVVVK